MNEHREPVGREIPRDAPLIRITAAGGVAAWLVMICVSQGWIVFSAG